MELRDSVRNNWTTTGQELTKELRQFWQVSRPVSPTQDVSRKSVSVASKDGRALLSPKAASHLSHLEATRQGSPSGRASSDFVTGYSLGLIGGVRSWVGSLHHGVVLSTDSFQMTRGVLTKGSRPVSPDGSSEESPDPKSPEVKPISARGRQDARPSTDAMDIN